LPAMASLVPMMLYGLEVPAGEIAISARPDIPSAFRITMAAIDPSAEPEGEEGTLARATLKIIRQSPYDLDDDEDDDSDFDVEEMERILAGDNSEESDDEDVTGGPSDPAKSKKAKKEAAKKEIRKLLEEEGMDIDDAALNGINSAKKSAKALGKMPASEDDEDDEDEDDEDEDSDFESEIEEFVVCTLDPAQHYQQPLDITIGENERVWFKVTGTHTIYLTGNYVELGHVHGDEDEDDDMDGYDLEPDSDELDEYDEEDDLDDLSDPRITELDEDEDEEAPPLVEVPAKKKGKNKRLADEEITLDEQIAKANADDEKLSKKAKKVKKNDGTASAAAAVEAPATKSDKKVTFAKKLEMGPTPAKETKASDGSKTVLGVKKVQGVTIDDKKLGAGPAAKSGDRVSMRYIGKLEKDGKVFDSNKKGKPFTFKLGAGEVIKGWDIGIQGLSAGGERRITIPAHLAYGSKANGPIPANSTLVFDVKLLEINKGK